MKKSFSNSFQVFSLISMFIAIYLGSHWSRTKIYLSPCHWSNSITLCIFPSINRLNRKDNNWRYFLILIMPENQQSQISVESCLQPQIYIITRYPTSSYQWRWQPFTTMAMFTMITIVHIKQVCCPTYWLLSTDPFSTIIVGIWHLYNIINLRWWCHVVYIFARIDIQQMELG